MTITSIKVKTKDEAIKDRFVKFLQENEEHNLDRLIPMDIVTFDLMGTARLQARDRFIAENLEVGITFLVKGTKDRFRIKVENFVRDQTAVVVSYLDYYYDMVPGHCWVSCNTQEFSVKEFHLALDCFMRRWNSNGPYQTIAVN